MSDLIQTAEKEILRKEILNLCYQAGTVGCSTDVLAAAFAHAGPCDKKEIERQASYLEEKGLVKVEPVGNERLNISRKVVRLTAYGMDYIEGNTGLFAGIGG